MAAADIRAMVSPLRYNPVPLLHECRKAPASEGKPAQASADRTAMASGNSHVMARLARIVAAGYTAASGFGRPALAQRQGRSDQGQQLPPRQRWDPRGILIFVVGVRLRHELLQRLDRARHKFLQAETAPWAHPVRGESHRPGLPRNY